MSELETVTRNEVGELHSFRDRPAVELFDGDGNLIRQQWFRNGAQHRDEGPAEIDFRPGDGSVEQEEWFRDGKRSNPSGPALVEYHGNGRVAREDWILDNLYFRAEGLPEITYFSKSGKPVFFEFVRADGSLIRQVLPDPDKPALVKPLFTLDLEEDGSTSYRRIH